MCSSLLGKRMFRAGLTLLWVSSAGIHACDYLWQIGHPIPTGGMITMSAYGNGNFVGVGPDGDVATSHDGLVWRRQWSPAPEGFREIVFGNSLFIATSGQGASYLLHESPDGIRWRTISLSTPQQTVAFNRVLAAGEFFFGLMGKSLYSSRDGRAWAMVAEAPAYLADVCWGQGTYVAVSSEMSYLTSPDGIVWTQRTFPYPGPFTKILWGADKFVALGYGEGPILLILTSPDAATWTVAHFAPTVGTDCVARFGGGHFVLFSAWHGMWSADGDHWTNFEVEFHSITDVQWGDGIFLAFDYDRHLLTSADGLQWEDVTESGSLFVPSVFGLIHSENPEMFVAVGVNGMVATSPDGIQWDSLLLDPNLALLGIASGGGRLVAVGWGGVILASEDGGTWQDVSPATQLSFRAVAYGLGTFVAAGDNGVMYTSPDGLSWTQCDTGFRGTITGIAYGGGRFVAVGEAETLLHSSDGLSWSGTEDFLSGRRYPSVTYGNGVFVVATYQGSLLVGPDGETWQAVSTIGPVDRLAFAAGQFFGWGYRTAVTSYDGIHWTTAAPGLGAFDLPASDGNIVAAVRASGGREPAFLWATTCFPAVSSVDRDTFPVEGGPTVGITGSHLGEATDVRFGDVSSPQFTVHSDDLIVAVSPAQPAGAVAITVTTPGGTSRPTGSATVVVGSRPEVHSIKKLSGPFRLKILGTGFNGSSIVLVNGTPAPSSTLKRNGALLAGGGNLLKIMLPKGQTAQIVVLNTDTGIFSRPFAFTP
jgi:hypothetical protein